MATDLLTPRRKWHLKRWFIVFVVAFCAWSGWRVVDFRSAIKEARALGWVVKYTDPAKEIRADWDNVFRKETWTEGVTWVGIPTSEAFQQHVAIVHRLNPRGLQIADASALRDLSAVGLLKRLESLALHGSIEPTNLEALKNLPALEAINLRDSPMLTSLDGLKHLFTLKEVILVGCTGLTNVDPLKNLPGLKDVYLEGCTGLTNVDGLKRLSALGRVELTDCTGLTRESVDALKAALPKAAIIPP